MLNWRILLALSLIPICCAPPHSLAQAPPDVPQQYRRLFYHYADHRKLYEKALNAIGLTKFPVGRSFAIIAGVTQYPNFPKLEQTLRPAQVDIEKLKSYLKDQEFFDEIIVLKDGDMNLDTLNYFLDDYFPALLQKSPHSRFLFAYSGHGYAESTAENARGYLLTSPAISKTDPVNRINLSTLRTMLNPEIDSAEKTLVLINACQSGAFLGRQSFGVNPLGPGDRGAYAILASRKTQLSWSVSSVGPGSVFFEKIFAGLNGAADKSPADGVVTYRELDTYLHQEIPSVTNNNQIPMEGDISRDGSQGEFFFLNRNRQVQLGNSQPWNPSNLASFGVENTDLVKKGEEALARGEEALQQQRYPEALEAFGEAADAGNSEGMRNLGILFKNGVGVPTDYGKAREWYEKAVALGNTDAMANLAFLYINGIGVPPDYLRARQLEEPSAAAGNYYAMDSLGFLYEHGLGVERDYTQSFQWYEKAVKAGHTGAIPDLARSYEQGLGVKRDYDQALVLYRKAADGGDPHAMLLVGSLYEKGRGVAPDMPQARQWYEKAAEKGNAEAMLHLGIIYESGQGVSQDLTQAREWFQKAAAAGNPDAPKRLQELPK